jgi:hypothetical protein
VEAGVKGRSRIDSIVLGQHAVYNNLEERKRNGSVPAAKPYGALSAEGGVSLHCHPINVVYTPYSHGQ